MTKRGWSVNFAKTVLGLNFYANRSEAETEALFGLSFDEVLQNEESFGPIHVEKPQASSPNKSGSGNWGGGGKR